MRNGNIAIYYGVGKGKTSVSLGKGILALADDLRVVMIQFLSYYDHKEIALLENMEPDFRVFRFEKYRDTQEMTEEMKKEITSEIRNGFNFVKKIIDTGECDMLMLDGILECIKEGYLTEQELLDVMEKRPEYMDMILTGSSVTEGIVQKADFVYQITTEKEPI